MPKMNPRGIHHHLFSPPKFNQLMSSLLTSCSPLACLPNCCFGTPNVPDTCLELPPLPGGASGVTNTPLLLEW